MSICVWIGGHDPSTDGKLYIYHFAMTGEARRLKGQTIILR